MQSGFFIPYDIGAVRAICPQCRRQVTAETHKIEGKFAQCYTDPWITSKVLTEDELAANLQFIDRTLVPSLVQHANGEKKVDIDIHTLEEDEVVVTWITETEKGTIVYQMTFVSPSEAKPFMAQTVTADVIPKGGKGAIFISHSEMILNVTGELIRAIFKDHPLRRVLDYHAGIPDVLKTHIDYPITLAAFAGKRKHLRIGENKVTLCGLDLTVKIEEMIGIERFLFPREVSEGIQWFHWKAKGHYAGQKA